jgi:uracil-DNA glycosylase
MARYQIEKPCRMCPVGAAYDPKPIQVFGQSSCRADEVKLIVVGNYPGGNDVRMNLSIAPDIPVGYNSSPREKINHNLLKRSAGGYFRLMLRQYFSPEIPLIEQYTYFTNAVKCMPKKLGGKAGNFKVTDSHAASCMQYHLMNEIALLPAGIPILLCSSTAMKAFFPKMEGGVALNRRHIYYWREHPVVITMNPVEAERGHMRHVVEDDTVNGIHSPTRLRYGDVLFGSRPWLLAKDIQLIKELVLESQQCFSSTPAD